MVLNFFFQIKLFISDEIEYSPSFVDKIIVYYSEIKTYEFLDLGVEIEKLSIAIRKCPLWRIYCIMRKYILRLR